MKRRLNAIFYQSKHAKPTDENIFRLLLPSIVGILLCLVCLAGTTWAWFSASVQTPPQTITTAHFDISVSIVDGSNEAVIETAEGGYSLSENTAYTVKLTAVGTAREYGGYCVVKGGVAPHYTTPLLPGATLSFTLIPDTTAVYTFTAVWGKCSNAADITADCTIGQEVKISSEDNTPLEKPASSSPQSAESAQ